MDYLIKIGNVVYAYCTDFIINLANLLGLSYYEVNAIIFCFIYPIFIFILTTIFLFQKRRLNNYNLDNGFKSHK